MKFTRIDVKIVKIDMKSLTSKIGIENIDMKKKSSKLKTQNQQN